MLKTPEIIQGGKYVDERGTLSFINNFSLSDVKRFYVVEHPCTSTIRAWQAHRIEKKWFYVISGVFKIVTIKIDDWKNPSEKLGVQEFLLNGDDSQILYIPEGYANGFQAIMPNSKMVCFSNLSTEDSKEDDFRFCKNRWYQW